MKKIKLDNFMHQKYITGLKASPDEKHVAITVFTPDIVSNDYLASIWVFDCITSDYHELTFFDSSAPFIWLDAETILYPALKDENLQKRIELGEQWTVYNAVNIKSKETKEFMRIPLFVSDLRSIGGNEFLLTAMYDHYGINLNTLTGKERESAIQLIKESKDYEVLDEVPFWSNVDGYTNKKRNRLYTYNKKNGSISAISGKFENILIEDQKDGKILYISEHFENISDLTNSLHLYNTHTGENMCILDNDKGYMLNAAVFLGNTIVVCGIDDAFHNLLVKNNRFYIVEEGNLKLLAEHDFGMYDTVFSDHYFDGGAERKAYGDVLYFIATENRSSFIKKLTLDGKIEKLTEDHGSINHFEICDGEIMFVGYRSMRPQELYYLTAGAEKQVTKYNDHIVKTKNIIPHEYITFENDGFMLEGYVLKPADFDERKSYPGILNIHGGPKTVFGDIYYHEMQFWANEGYFVFFCNPRGSDGRGEAFANINGKYGTIDYDDIMKFTDVVLEKYPQLNPDRLGVTGESYGGYMSNWIIGHTHRFKCAASQGSISNWFSFGISDVGYFCAGQMINATIWEDPEKYWWHSPLKYADKVTTPTLFIHSAEDYRCCLTEALQMFISLKCNGVETRLCVFKGENHFLGISGKPKNRIRRLKEMTNWFDKYLK